MKELLRPADLAPMLGVTPARVYQLIASGELPGVRIGGALRVPREAWEKWLAEANTRAMASLKTGEGK